MIGIDLCTKSHDECMSIRDTLRSSVKTERNPGVLVQLSRNLAIVENYIAKAYEKPTGVMHRPLSISEARWSN